MAQKKISDEQIAAALLERGTIKQAAAACGISERAIYDRMNTNDFQSIYKAAKADIIRAAVFNLNGQLQAAVNTIAEIMADKTATPGTRLQAAQMILTHAHRAAQRLQEDETAARIASSDYFNITF